MNKSKLFFEDNVTISYVEIVYTDQNENHSTSAVKSAETEWFFYLFPQKILSPPIEQKSHHSTNRRVEIGRIVHIL